MKCGAPYMSFAVFFRRFLEDHGYASPNDFHRDLEGSMGEHAPKYSTVWMAFYGARLLPLETILFMRERYGFKVKWQECLATRNLEGIEQKTNQMTLPGMRELKGGKK